MNPFRSSSNRGFTIVELAAVLAAIAVLSILSFPAMARAKGQSRRTQCSSNLRQFALAEHIYGAEFKDRLPTNNVGNWLWDTAWYIGERLEGYGEPSAMMYCPGTAPRFSSQDNENLYEYYAGGYFHVLGYAPTFAGTLALITTNANASLIPQSIQSGAVVLPPALPSQRVLVADATISLYGQYSYSQRYTYNWSSILGGYPVPHITPHLAGAVPAGGNEAMLDGHVEWRKFDDMQCRTTPGGPGFWW